MSIHSSPEPEATGNRINSSAQPRARFSFSNLPIKYRLPLAIGILLSVILSISAWASYQVIRELSLETGRERLRNLTQQFSSLSQQSTVNRLNKTVTVANDPVIGAFLQSPSPSTKMQAMTILQQFSPAQDPSSLQVELWNANYSLALVIPEDASPEPTNLEKEFKQSATDPFMTVGELRVFNDAIRAPAVAAARDDAGGPIGYLVTWRKISVNPEPRQLKNLLGDHATLYFGNTLDDVWTDLIKPVPKPPVSLDSSSTVTEYTRDGNSFMALGRPIDGTPWSIVVEVSDQVFASQASEFLRRMILIGLVLFLVGVGGAFVLSQNITRPLKKLTAAACYSQTVDLRRGDELGVLANAFNAMILMRHDSQPELERKVQERTLQLEAAPCAMLMVDQRARVTVVNRQAEQLFGYSRAELLEQRIEKLIPEGYRSAHPRHRKMFSQAPTARVTGAGRDLYGLRKDGSEIPIEIGLNPIQTEQGDFVLASIIDITERRRSQERFRQLIECAPNGMVMVDQKGNIVLVNTQIEKAFGYSRDELLGRSIEILVPQRFRAHHASYRNGYIANPAARPMGAGRDLYGLRKDGSEFPVEIGLNPMETEQGTMILGTIVDITERKQVEQELRRSKEQLAGIISSAMDAIITVDREQRIVLFNDAAEKMFLFPSEDAIGQPLDRFIPERFRAGHHDNIRRFAETNVTKRSMGALGALFAVRANGQEFPIEASISQIELDQQKLFTVILRDVTARKQVEAALKEQTQILELAPVFIRDPVSDQLVFWNKGAEQMYGWTAEEALGKVVYELLRTESDQPREKIQAILFARGHWEGELVHTRRDGKRIVVASHWVVHRDDEGNPKAVLEVNNDITNLRQAEEKLTRLATAVEQSGDSIVITDADGNVQYVNPAFEETTGYSSKEVVGRNPRFLKSGNASREYYEHLWKTITSGSQWTGHFTNRKKDGTLFEEEATISPVRDGAGKIISYVAVKRDVTERMRAEEQIRLLNEELEQRVADRTAQLEAANKELEAFSYSVSHDLRAPLRHINGFSQALLEDYADQLDATGKSYLQEVRGASQEMAQLIDDVLQLARVTRGEMSTEKISLSELAHTVIGDLKKKNGQRDVRVEIEEGLFTRGDKRLLQIMLTNLLGNAWKFTSKRERAEIAFGRQKCGSDLLYFVRDNGAGFDMAYANKLFGAFQRLHTGGEFEGTGIGLATVQRIVTRHGGRVWADAKVNEGATFYFVLPDFKEIQNE
jgi:PAS domain S-box-containing protein